MTYEHGIEAVRAEMSGELSEMQIGFRLKCVIQELDEILALANNPETADLVDHHQIAVGQVMSRAQLIAAFLLDRSRKPGLRLIRNPNSPEVA